MEYGIIDRTGGSEILFAVPAKGSLMRTALGWRWHASSRADSLVGSDDAA
ncbi:hypothetical protein SAMN04488556_0290 [Halostagnicola kamekurae]|uniref:Uncharacterized protein n=1 Tax=Halostagnicola kamekurae TaxID=619731 RepID=A0A1I6P3E3_9EURY|nr:hypothetical protein SAMN04488556_0290 [Halostagnicola kamekurae]